MEEAKSTPIQIRNRWSGAVLYEGSSGMTMRETLEASTLSGADLSDAYLSGSDLRDANLIGSDLRDANLIGSDLRSADLSGANLSGSDLRGANLRGANLIGSNLSDAYLSGANLSGAKNADLAIARTRILGEGSLIGWKKCIGGVIVKLRIPEDAKRSHAFGRKCRAEYVDVQEVFGAEQGISQHDRKTVYAVGQRVMPDKFCENWMDECSNGIHFFITRIEAENY